MSDRISDKAQMYRLLASGALGNTVPQWFDLQLWRSDPAAKIYPLWGVRSLIPMHKKMRLNCPAGEVESYVIEHHGGRANLSPMVDHCLTMRGQIVNLDLPGQCGLYLHYVEGQREIGWREAFDKFGQHSSGTTARLLLRRHLWPSDLDDLYDLLSRYDGHVIEFTACERPIGVLPMKNTIIWEVRNY